MEFKPGDIVRLKSGGPAMTVESMGDDGINCVWFDGKRRQAKRFVPQTLTTAEPSPPEKITLNFPPLRGRGVGSGDASSN
jgi:uncharacterized protein YodC (DUF2158 family)